MQPLIINPSFYFLFFSFFFSYAKASLSSEYFEDCSASGTILREVWSNANGINVSDIPFNTPPTFTELLTSFEGPIDIADNYGTRIRGYVCVPQSGNYTFWISGDDFSELWLSPDDNPANKVLIAQVPGWTNSRRWGKYSEQQSAPIPLVAGETYYIEALHKEARGGDNIAVGWRLPDGTLERPIQGDKLSPFVPEHSSTPPVANAGSNQVLVLPNNSTALNGTASNDLGGTIVNYSWVKTSGPSTYNLAGANTATPIVSNLVAGEYIFELTVTDNDGLSSSNAVTVNVFSSSNSVFNSNDPIVVYNPNNPPRTPARGTVSKWVITRRLNWNTDSYKAYLYVAPNGLKMAFRLKFPKTYDPYATDGKLYPLIIMLHGRGEGGDIYDNEFSMRHGGQIHRDAVDNGKFDGFVMYPQSPQGWWGKFFDPIELMVQKFVEEIKVDPNRVNIHGLSSGGQGVWNYIQEKPRLFATAIPMSAASSNYTEGLSGYIYMPLWLSQGGLDTSPTPRAAENLVEAIRAAGGNIRFTLYPDLGHGVWNRHYNEPDFFPFMVRANKTNPHVFFGKTEFCPGETINVRLGVSAGFQAYEWRKDGSLIAGATSNEIVVTQPGEYSVRFKRSGIWTYWSPMPAKIVVKDPTPAVQIIADGSTTLPALDGKTSVTLSAPTGFAAYAWSNGAISQSILVNQAGSYRVSVTAQGGCIGTFSSPVVVSVNGTNGPSTPTNFTATTASTTQINLSWQDVAGNETGYEIYRSTSLNGNYILAKILPVNSNSYQDQNLPFNTTFFYKLRAVNNNGGSSVVTTNGTTLQDTQPPATPSNLSATVLNENEIKLAWKDNAYNELGFEVHRALSLNGTYTLLNPNPANANAVSFIDDNIMQNTTYYYKVRATNGNGKSNFSNTVSTTTFNRAPVLTRIGRIYAKSDKSSTFSIVAINDDPQETTTLSVNGLPSFASFQDRGNGNGIINLNPSRNHIGMYHQVAIIASDNKGASVTEVVSIEVKDGEFTSVYVNFNNTLNENFPWNNFSSSPQTSTSLNNLKNDDNNITNIDIVLQNSWTGATATGKNTGNNTGVYTDRVMQTAYFENSTNTKTLRVTGLSSANKYNFIFFGSRDNSSNFNTNYTIGGTTVTLNASHNTSNTVQINGVYPNSAGEATINIAKASGATSAVLSAMVIQIYPNNGLPLPPSSLVATGNSLSSILLLWNDNSDNETGFQIWRSSAQSGTYSLIGTAPANATSFTNNGLANNTTYYYKLKAINSTGTSNFSNIAAGTTVDFVALVNVNRADNSGIPSYWNNFNSNPGVNVKISNLISTASVQTGITITSLTPWTGEFNDGPVTGNNSGIYPDNVLKTFYYVFPGETGQMKLSGLKSNYLYDIKILGNWRAASQTDYTINNITLQQNNYRNTSNVATFLNVAPTNGEIVITVKSSAGSQAGLLNAIEIIGKRSTNPAARYLDIIAEKDKSQHFDEQPIGNAVESLVYPNPFENSLSIDLGQPISGMFEISIHDLTGRTIYQKELILVEENHLIEISLSENNIKPGVYLLKTNSNSSGTKLYRIVKN